MNFSDKYIEGVFVRELNNRFLCEVNVNGQVVLCYVPSSCKLGNLLELKEKKVLLTRNNSKKLRTHYSLFAINHNDNFILLNSAIANTITAQNINSDLFLFLGSREEVLKEKNVEGYKADLYINDTKTIIEVKSIISTEKCSKFMSIYSERLINQLKEFQKLIKKGYAVCLVIVSLSSFVEKIVIDPTSYFYNEYKRCKDLGMKTVAYNCYFDGHNIIFNNPLEII